MKHGNDKRSPISAGRPIIRIRQWRTKAAISGVLSQPSDCWLELVGSFSVNQRRDSTRWSVVEGEEEKEKKKQKKKMEEEEEEERKSRVREKEEEEKEEGTS